MSNKLIAALLLTAPCLAHADAWSGEIAAGYLATTGNSSSRALNAKGALTYLDGPWKNSTVATAVTSADHGVTTAESYTAGNKLDYNFTAHDYAFGSVEWAKDLFGGIRERYSETVGYGRHLLTGPAHKLDAEIGGGARQTTDQGTLDHHDDIIGRAALTYGWKISDTAALAENLKSEFGESNTYVESATELKVIIIGSLAASLSYLVKHNTHVASGIGRTDTQTAANLSYSFGDKS